MRITNYLFTDKEKKNWVVSSHLSLHLPKSFNKIADFFVGDALLLKALIMPLEKICFIAETIDDLNNWYKKKGIYALLKNDLDLCLDQMLNCMIDDEKRQMEFDRLTDGEPILPIQMTLRHIRECEKVAKIMAHFLKEITTCDVEICIHELLINAIEHGHLKITRAEKVDLLSKGLFYDHVMHCHNHIDCLHKKVSLFCDITPSDIMISIQDEGEGFDQNTLGTIDLPCGRGLYIVKQLSDRLIYNEKGNGVTVYFKKNI
jgi:anti-sigma regulatory factor (Ser/Thr protein kinase)